MDHILADGVLVDICLGLLPELEVAAASRDMRRACETAAEVLIRQKWSTLADVHVEHTPWRGLAACWARNAAWLRAPQVVAPDRAHVWRDALGRKPQAQARPGAAGGPRAEAEPAPAGLVLEHLDEPIQEGVAVVVASAAGDCTIFDCASTEGAQRLELCHGYPFPATDAAQPRVSLFQPGRGGARATVHRGRTRSTGALRVYTVVLTKRTRGKRAAEQDLGADLFVGGGAPYQTFRLPPVPIPRRARRSTARASSRTRPSPGRGASATASCSAPTTSVGGLCAARSTTSRSSGAACPARSRGASSAPSRRSTASSSAATTPRTSPTARPRRTSTTTSTTTRTPKPPPPLSYRPIDSWHISP